MNLNVSAEGEQLFIQTAKVNKKVATEKTPFVLILEIVGEEIIPTHNKIPTEEITPENWVEKIWIPLVELLSEEYAKKPAFVTVEACWTNSEGNYMSVPVFFKWCPETGVKVKDKMMYGSSFQSLKRKLDIQGTTPELGLVSDLEINQFAKLANIKGWVNQ